MANRRQRGIRSNIQAKEYSRNIGGVKESISKKLISLEYADKIENLHSSKVGLWSGVNVGYTRLNSTAYESGATINCLTKYLKADGTKELLAISNAKLQRINTTTGASTVIDSSTGLTTTNQISSKQLFFSLYFVDGAKSSPRKWDGTTAGNASGWPVSDGVNSFSKPKFVDEFNGRAVFANFNGYPAHIILSDFNAPETFTFPATTSLHSFIGEAGGGDGEAITGMRSVYLPSSNLSNLVIYKANKIYLMTGDSSLASDTTAFQIIRINHSYGAINNACIVQFGNDLLSLSEVDGGYSLISLGTAVNSGDLQPQLIGSDAIKETLQTINRTYAHLSWGAHFPERKEIWFVFPAGSSTVPNTAVVYRYASGEGDAPRWSTRTFLSHNRAVTYDSQYFFAGTDGHICKFFNGSLYHQTGIPFLYEYPRTYFNSERQKKRITDARIYYLANGQQPITIVTDWQGGGNNNRSSLNYTLSGNTAAVYGAATYGASYYSAESISKQQFKVFGNGENFKLKIKGTLSDKNFEFYGADLMVEYGATSAEWK